MSVLRIFLWCPSIKRKKLEASNRVKTITLISYLEIKDTETKWDVLVIFWMAIYQTVD